MAEHPADDDHGNTIAAWVTVAVLLVAVGLMAIAVAIVSKGLFIAGAVLAVLGLVVGRILKSAGYGKKAAEGSAQG